MFLDYVEVVMQAAAVAAATQLDGDVASAVAAAVVADIGAVADAVVGGRDFAYLAANDSGSLVDPGERVWLQDLVPSTVWQ